MKAVAPLGYTFFPMERSACKGYSLGVVLLLAAVMLTAASFASTQADAVASPVSVAAGKDTIRPSSAAAAPSHIGTAPAAIAKALESMLENLDGLAASMVTTNSDEALQTEALQEEEHLKDTTRKLLALCKGIPDPVRDPVAFVEVEENLEAWLQKLGKELHITLAKTHGAAGGRASPLEHKLRALRALLAEADKLKRTLERTWTDAFPDPAERELRRAEAYKELSKRRSIAREETLRRLEEHREKLSETLKRASEIEKKAARELERASSSDEEDLARLRLQYARYQARMQEYALKAIEAEKAAVEAEARLQRCKARAAEAAALVERSSDPAVVETARDRLMAEARTLRAQARALSSENELLREEIPALREEVERVAERYEALESGLEKHRNDKLYRRRVYYARMCQKFAAGLLDEYRNNLEWREKRRTLLESAADVLDEAAARIRSPAVLLGQSYRQLFEFLALLLLTMACAWLLTKSTNRVIKQAAARSEWEWDDVAVEELEPPILMPLLAGGVWIALKRLSIPAESYYYLQVARKAFLSVWSGYLCWKLVNLANSLIEPAIEASEYRLDKQLYRFIRRTIRVLIVVFTIVFVLEAFGCKVSSLLAGLGLGGLAFALAAKDTIANLFGSIVIFVDRPFKVGNWVVINGVEGIVEDIGIRSTRIRTFKDTLVTIPNATVANASAENIHSFRKRRLYFKINLRLDTPIDKVKEAVEKIRTLLDEHPMILDGHYVYVTGLTDFGIEMMIYCFVATTDWRIWLQYSEEIYLRLLELLEHIGVELAYPTQTIAIETTAGPIRFEPAPPQSQPR